MPGIWAAPEDRTCFWWAFVVDLVALMCWLSAILGRDPAWGAGGVTGGAAAASTTSGSLSCAWGHEREATGRPAPWPETTRRGQPDVQREDAECAGRLPQSHSQEQDPRDHLFDQRGQAARRGQLVRQFLLAPAPRRTCPAGLQTCGVDGDAGGRCAPL